MDFSLMLTPQKSELQLAESRNAILATNQLAFTLYGMQLTEEEAEMIVETCNQAMDEEELAEFGTGIVPRLVHWFLPTGYLGYRYAEKLASLSEVFYHIKGRLHTICEDAGETGIMLSDNAIIHYMYILFVSPACAGDIDTMAAQAEQIVCGTMQRLLTLRAKQRKAHRNVLAGDRDRNALYADLLKDEFGESDMERRSADERCADMYNTAMESLRYMGDPADGRDEGEMYAYTRGTFAEELEAALMRNPAMLIPAEQQEAEWDSMAEEWEEADAAAAKAAEAALRRLREEPKNGTSDQK